MWPEAQFGAVVLFLSAMVLLLLAVVCAIIELLSALEVVESETILVCELSHPANNPEES